MYKIEEQQLKTDQSIVSAEKSLPPNVFGYSRGFLELTLDNVQWRVNAYQQVEVRVVWWGESYEKASLIRLHSQPITIIYEVSTNTELFKKYLQGCEAIEIQLTSLKTNRPIGTAFAPVPAELVQFEDHLPVVFSKRHSIFSPKNTKVGELNVNLKLILFEDFRKDDLLIENNQLGSVYKEKDYSLAPLYKARSKLRESSAPKTSRIWNFLRGKDMDGRDEADTLREICLSSPADSIIEAMDEELTYKLKDFYYSNKENVMSNIPSGMLKTKSCNREHVEPSSKESRNSGTQTNNSTLPSDKKVENQTSSVSSTGKQNTNHVSTSELKESPSIDDYQGLFYVGGLKNLNESEKSLNNFYIISQNLSSTDDSLVKSRLSDQNLYLNFLKFFPVSLDPESLEKKMRNKHLSVEVWSRNVDNDEKVGSVQVNLHQFYVAFKDATVRNRLKDLTMPVITVDGWTNIELNENERGQLELILAIGTRAQIDYLVKMKRLMMVRDDPVPITTRSQASSILSAFLDNLSHQIASKRGVDSPSCQSKSGEIRKTSDLLDVLQKALVSPPDPQQLDMNLLGSMFSSPPPSSKPEINPVLPKPVEVTENAGLDLADVLEPESRENLEDYFRVSVEIESAMHLPKINGKENNKKKSGRRNKPPRKSLLEVEPSCYATFESQRASVNYSTRVIERNCNPVWNKEFQVLLHRDLLVHPEKYFIIKLWRKAVDIPQCRPLPNPTEDVVIGFSTIDLKALTAGLPEICGWYNVVYFNGKCNGQIKIKIRPLEPIPHQDVLANRLKSTDSSSNSVINQPLEENVGNVTLGRALKRKFTELEEITQRLRARLHDVTGNSEEDEEVYDDEFERDLNTSVDEVDEEQVGMDFDWLGNLTEDQRRTVELDVSGRSSDDTMHLYTKNGKIEEADQSIAAQSSRDLFNLEDALKHTTIFDDDAQN